MKVKSTVYLLIWLIEIPKIKGSAIYLWPGIEDQVFTGE